MKRLQHHQHASFVRILVGAAATVSIVGNLGSAHANGFILNDHGANTTGRVNAVAATIDNGAAIVYNPAGLATRRGVNVYVGASFILPDSSFTYDRTGETTDNEVSLAVTPTVFAHGSVTDFLSVGIGFHTPFGSTIRWPATSPGRDEIREQTLRTFFVTPAAALNLDRWVKGLRIGAGIDLVPSSVELKRDILFGSDVATAQLGGTAFGIGGRAGVMYDPPGLKQLSLGVAYRSQVKLNFTGSGDFDAPMPYRSQLPPDGDIETDVTLPQSVLAGVAFRPIPSFEIELDLQWMGWSSFDELVVELPGDADPLISDRGYEDTFTFRVGVEYDMRWLNLEARAGYAYDPTPIPRDKLTMNLPDIDRHVVSLGGSYHLPQGRWIDVGVLWVLPGDRSTSDKPNEPLLKGSYDVSALVAAISFGASFGNK